MIERHAFIPQPIPDPRRLYLSRIPRRINNPPMEHGQVRSTSITHVFRCRSLLLLRHDCRSPIDWYNIMCIRSDRVCIYIPIVPRHWIFASSMVGCLSFIPVKFAIDRIIGSILLKSQLHGFELELKHSVASSTGFAFVSLIIDCPTEIMCQY